MTVTPEEVARLRELSEKATPGPWDASAVLKTIMHSRAERARLKISTTPEVGSEPDNAALIAAARNALPALLDAYEAEKAAREKAEAQLADEENRAESAEEDAARAEARADRLAKALEPFRRVQAQVDEETADRVRIEVSWEEWQAIDPVDVLAEEPKT